MEHYGRILPDSDLPIGFAWMHRQFQTALHSHTFHELVVVLAGTAEHECAGRTCRIAAGDLFLIKPGMPHRYYNTCELELVNVLYLAERVLTNPCDLAVLPGYHAFFEFEPAMRELHAFEGRLHVGASELEQIRLLLDQYRTELCAKRPGFVLASVLLLQQMILLISRMYHGGTQNDAQNDLYLLGKALSTMQTEYNKSEHLKIARLAKLAGMSESSFHRAFRKTLGTSPGAYILRLRMEHAADLLRRTELSVMEIAGLAGFVDSNYFSRMFRKTSGHTPRAYRKRSHGE